MIKLKIQKLKSGVVTSVANGRKRGEFDSVQEAFAAEREFVTKLLRQPGAPEPIMIEIWPYQRST